MKTKKKVLVTGCAGFIGQHLVRKLTAYGYHVAGLDIVPKPEGLAVDTYTIFDLTKLTVGDLTSWLGHIDYVFHLAARARVSLSIDDPLGTHEANVTATLRLLQWAHQRGVEKFIYSSSSSVYGTQDILPLHEKMTPYPQSPYGVQKLAGEFYAETFRMPVYGLPTVSLRYFNVFGEGQDTDHPYAPVVAKFLSLHQQNKQLTIYGDGYQTRDMTYVGDVAMANILAAESDVTGIFNIAGGKNYTVNAIAQIVGGDVVYLPARAGEPRDSLADITRARHVLGFTPLITLEEWIYRQMAQ